MAILSRDVVIPLADYPTGERTFTLNNLDDSAQSFRMELARCTTATPDIWPNAATEIRFRLLVSVDNGQTWIPSGGAGAGGGIQIRRDGTEAPLTVLSAGLIPGTKRRLRLYIEVINGPLRTSGTLELRDS